MPAKSVEQLIEEAQARGSIQVTKVTGVNLAALAAGQSQRLALPLPGRKKPERAFQDDVAALAQSLGWLVMAVRHAHVVNKGKDAKDRYTTPFLYDGAGWLDMTFVRDRFFVAELKVGSNKPTPAQRKWLKALRLAGVENYVWKPEDMEFIRRTLA